MIKQLNRCSSTHNTGHARPSGSAYLSCTSCAACGRGRTAPDAPKAILFPWPVDRPARWDRHVNDAITSEELKQLRTCVQHAQPYGDESWTREAAKRLRLEHTLRRVGGPTKEKAVASR